MNSRFVTQFARIWMVAISATLIASDALAVPLSMMLDTNQSSISLSGTFNSLPLAPQGPGAATATYSGSISVDVNNLAAPSSIEFLGSSAVAAITGQWRPEAGGGPAAGNPGVAQDANYGLQLAGGALGTAYAAVRNLQFNVTGGPVAVVAGAFPSTQSLNVVSGLFAFNLPPAFMTPPGQDDLAGDVLTNASATPSTYSVVGSTATLRIPINIVDQDDLTTVYSGQLVATAQIPEPSSLVLIGLTLAAWTCFRGNARFANRLLPDRQSA
jgi:hypothetical protein